MIEPARELLNTIFMLKMLLVATAAVACWILRRSLSRNPQSWGDTPRRVISRCTGVFFFSLLVDLDRRLRPLGRLHRVAPSRPVLLRASRKPPSMRSITTTSRQCDKTVSQHRETQGE
jgi:hypothetical protein